jgi:hypothetical protein
MRDKAATLQYGLSGAGAGCAGAGEGGAGDGAAGFGCAGGTAGAGFGCAADIGGAFAGIGIGGGFAGGGFADGTFITFLRKLLANPEMLVWEKFWLERNKDLDRELYGLVKWCKPKLPFGLNVWNRNHFNIFRRAQWPWAEQTGYADFVKPITYQHQAGEVWAKELGFWRKTILRDFEPGEATAALFRILGLNEAPWEALVSSGMNPDTYVAGQCADALRGVEGRAKVYMGIGVDAPRSRPDTAKMTKDIVYRSVMATYRAGGHGIVLAPNYASMHLTHLDGVAEALAELGLR